MAIKSPASTPAWIRAKTTRRKSLRAHPSRQQMDQSRPVPFVPRPARCHHLAIRSRLHHPQSTGVHPAHDRRLDLAFPGHHPHHHAAAPASSPSRANPFSPNARPLRLFLRLPAFHHLSLVRQAFRCSRNLERRLQAPVHHRGLSRVHSAHSSGDYIDRRLDSPPRRPPLAHTAPRHLHQRRLWSHSLLLAGEIRGDPSAVLRGASGYAAGLARGRMAFAAQANGTRQRGAATKPHQRFSLILLLSWVRWLSEHPRRGPPPKTAARA